MSKTFPSCFDATARSGAAAPEPTPRMNHRRQRPPGLDRPGGRWPSAARLVLGVVILGMAVATTAADDVPRFQVDPSWPKTLPNNWILGQASGVAVDDRDHVWVLHRPRSLTDDEKAATFKP